MTKATFIILDVAHQCPWAACFDSLHRSDMFYIFRNAPSPRPVSKENSSVGASANEEAAAAVAVGMKLAGGGFTV